MNRNYKKTIIITIVLIAGLVLYLFINSMSNKGFINRIANEGEIEAISKVKSVTGFKDYLDKPGKVKGMLGMGGKESRQISGELEAKVKSKSDGTYQVTLTEYWSSKDFRYEGSKEGIQSHFITYEVKGDEVKLIENGGDFPPEQVK